MPNYRNILTDVIYQLESSAGKNKKAYVPNQYGALGGFQLTPGAYVEIQKLDPRWRNMSFKDVAVNDSLAREAASDYLTVLFKQLEAAKAPLTNTNLLAAYHSGARNVARGTLGPYGRDYVSRARALAGVRPEETW